MKLFPILILSVASTGVSALIVPDSTRRGNKQNILPIWSYLMDPMTTPLSLHNGRGDSRVILSSSVSFDSDTAASATKEFADSLFDSIDVNDDGGISNDELRVYLKEAGYSTESIRLLFTALDKNADGVISREEMRYAFSTYEVSAMHRAFGLDNSLNQVKYNEAVKEIRSSSNIDDKTEPEMFAQLAEVIFNMIDTDNSGEIDRKELREYFRDANSSSTFRDIGDATNISVENIFSALDVNSDGAISKDEMISGFQQFDHKALSKAFGFAVSKASEV